MTSLPWVFIGKITFSPSFGSTNGLDVVGSGVVVGLVVGIVVGSLTLGSVVGFDVGAQPAIPTIDMSATAPAKRILFFMF
jgi:hypothetical protein